MTQSDAVIEAAKTGDVAAVRELVGADPALANARNAQGETPILAALYRGHRRVVDALLEARPRLDIFEAAAVGRLQRVRQLVERDPSLAYACAPDGFCPLGLACYFGHLETAEFLMDNGADIEAAARNGMQVRPLHAAAAARSDAIVAALLERGADPRARQQAGHTPLHAAAQNGDAEIVRLLLAYGADPAARNEAGATAADLARERGHAHLVDLLEVRRAGV